MEPNDGGMGTKGQGYRNQMIGLWEPNDGGIRIKGWGRATKLWDFFNQIIRDGNQKMRI